MRCILGLRTCLLGLSAILLLFPACSQGEGGRCQINSDCASGLTCSDTSGNGVCRGAILTGNKDAAPDLAEDSSASISPEVGSDAAAEPAIDAMPIDIGAVDSDSLDSEGSD